MACTVLLHQQCNSLKKVVYIPEIVKNYKTGPEYLQLTGDLNETQQLAAKYLTDIEVKIKKVEQLKTEETTKLEKYRSEIKEYVDKRFDELASQVTQLRDNDVSLLKDKHTKTKTIASIVATTKTKLKSCEQTPARLFTESKDTRNLVAQLQVDLAEIAAKSEYQMYSVRQDDQIEAVLKNKDGLARIVMNTRQDMTRKIIIYSTKN